MFHRKHIAPMLSALVLATHYSPVAQSQGAVQPGTIVGAQSPDDASVRAKMEVEKARLKAIEERKASRTQSLNLVKPAVKTAQELMQAKKYPEALARLADLDALAGKTVEEIYLIERTRIALASLVNDDVLLIKSLDAALSSGQAPPKERIELIDVLVRKYFNQKNFSQVITWSTRYFDSGGKDSSIRRAQLLSYYLNNDFARAKLEVVADIQAEETAGKRPSEEQLRLLVSCAQKLDDKVAYASAMEKYAMYYPKAN